MKINKAETFNFVLKFTLSKAILYELHQTRMAQHR